MGWFPTTGQILDLDGVRRRKDGFRFELCDQEHQPMGDLHPASTPPPRIQNDTKLGSQRRLSNFMLLPGEAQDVNPLTDRVRAYMVLQNGVEFRLGTFLWADANAPLRSWGSEKHSDLVDYGYILDQRTTQAFGWGRGANLALVVFFLLFRVGFTMEDIRHMGSALDRGLPEAKSWQPGATWRQMVTDIGDLVGFATPWFDRDGRLMFDEPPDPELTPSAVPSYEADTRIIANSVVPSNDLLSAPNDFGVFDAGTSRLLAGRHQLPASAPHSFAKRGFRIGLPESVQGLETQTQADHAARNLARKNAVAYEWLAFSSTLDPRHDTWDVVSALGQQWLEVTWSMELRSGGLMTHTLRRTTYDL